MYPGKYIFHLIALCGKQIGLKVIIYYNPLCFFSLIFTLTKNHFLPKCKLHPRKICIE